MEKEKFKHFTLLQLFSVVDGRLATKIEDVYEIYNHVFNDEFTNIGLLHASDKLESLRPSWFVMVESMIRNLKYIHGDDFNKLIEVIKESNPSYPIPQIQ